MNHEDGVDLGRLARAYAHRVERAARDHAGAAADAAGLQPGTVAIDVGGGTGTHATVFAARGSRSLVVDRSPEMARAARDAGVLAVVGDGARLPVGAASADLVYFHLSIHHGPAEQWIAEAGRVARPGGLVWVWTLDPGQFGDSFLARWFPSVAIIDRQRFPEPAHLQESMAHCGFEQPVDTELTEEVSRTAASWTAAVRAGFVSTLHLVDQHEIESGLAAFTRAHPDPEETVTYRLAFRRVSAMRSGLPF